LYRLINELTDASVSLSLIDGAKINYFYRPNYTSPYAPPYINVTLVTFSNVYTYSADLLWLAYGMAIGATIISIITGFITVSVNNGSYSDGFSTVLRIASNISLSRPLQFDETTGKQPTPDHVKDIVVSFPRDGRPAHHDAVRGRN
jgi:hypothetical protein